MFNSVYIRREAEIQLEYEKNLHKLRTDFVEENAEFKIGNFIGNVTGIIKIKDIGYEMIGNIPEIVYYGFRYKKNKGVISRTKDKKLSHLRNYSLKLIKS